MGVVEKPLQTRGLAGNGNKPFLKIAHVSATFPPYQGGTGNVCFSLARELTCQGHEVHVFTALSKGASPLEKMEGFSVHRKKPFVKTGNAFFLPSLLRALRGFDLIHLHYPFYGGELSALAARLYKVPLVITYHQDVLLEGWAAFVEKMLRFSLGRMTLRSASRLLFTSLDYAKSSYVTPLLRRREEIIGELSNGVDALYFRPGPPLMEHFERHHLSVGDKIILLVAGLDRPHYFKGVKIFLEAMTQLPPHFKGIIVGDGELRSSYEEAAKRAGLAERLIFTGRVSNEELRSYYRMAGVTVLPSVTRGEAFGLVLLESLASATPVIATDLPGVRTVVENERDGFVVEAASPTALSKAIQKIFAVPANRLEMGRQGRLKIEERYTWSELARRLETIYYEALEGWPVKSGFSTKGFS